MEASNTGRVRLRGGTRARTLRLTPAGYKMVNFWHNRKLIGRSAHELVLDAFYGPRPEGRQIRHLNGDRADNRFENLAYGTARENAADREAHGNTLRGQDNGNAKISDIAVKVIRVAYAAHVGSQYDLAELFGISQAQVFNIVNGHQRVREAS